MIEHADTLQHLFCETEEIPPVQGKVPLYCMRATLQQKLGVTGSLAYYQRSNLYIIRVFSAVALFVTLFISSTIVVFRVSSPLYRYIIFMLMHALLLRLMLVPAVPLL